MAPTVFFILIVGLLVLAAARLYGRPPSVPPPDTFMEDRLSRLMSADLIDELKTYANRTEQTVQEVIDGALREFLRRKKDEEGDESGREG
jgi:hypothetical protein